MATLRAVCGLDCSQCEAYQATQTNDVAAKERIAAQWRATFNSPDITADSVTCDGCLTDGRHGGYCGQCPVRACGSARGVPTCAHCSEFDNCATLAGFLAQGPTDELRKTLVALRASLNA